MKELKCPNCHSVFTVDEADYASIVSQIRTAELEEEVARRAGEIEAKMNAEKQSDVLRSEKAFQEQLGKKDALLSQKDVEIAQLREALKGEAQKQQIAYSDQLSDKDKEIVRLKAVISQKDSDKTIAVMEEQRKAQENLQKKTLEIAELQNRIDSEKSQTKINETLIKEQYEGRLKQKQEEVDFYKDMKTKMSTKMVGESLEQHCQIEFNRLRTTTFPRAYFDKDNDVVDGTKGDFVFRDYDEEGMEYISIMFEMKNEMDTTATKHKNEDFLAKLDKDRTNKKCEYAVLVTLLEADNELYNQGIVDMSYRYDKMYVIRPQFFLPLISLLTQAAKKSNEY